MAARLTAYLVVAIVVATVIAGLIVGAQRDDNDGPVDLIVHNATVYTAGGNRATAEAVAIRGNQILSVGSNREISRLKRPQTLMIDAGGGAVLPGFNDSHLNLIQGGLKLGVLNVSDAESTTNLLEQVAAWSRANPSARWIVGRGWSPSLFTKTSPSRQLLDAVVPDRPVVLYGATSESAWVNSKALELSEIDRKTADPVAGLIVRESRRGDPAGVLTGSAVRLVEKRVPPPTHEEHLNALRAAVAEANALGITSVQTAGDTLADLQLYEAARRAGDLTLRLYSALRVDAPLTEAAIAALDETQRKYSDDPLLKSGALFFPLDGEIATRRAAMLEPYEDDPDLSASTFDVDELNRSVRLADAAGWQIIIRAAGDRAVRMALGAIAHAVRSNRAPAQGRRHRIDHLALVDEADLPRFGPLGVVASMQPARGAPTAVQMERLARHLGEERANRTFAFRRLGEQTRVIFGSGWPLDDLNPFAGLHVAVNQQTPAGLPAAPWHAAERLPLAAAIDAYTATPAWASFDEHRKGSISAGMLADLVVLEQNIFERSRTRLAAATVAATIFDGKIVYQRVWRSETEPAPSLQH